MALKCLNWQTVPCTLSELSPVPSDNQSSSFLFHVGHVLLTFNTLPSRLQSRLNIFNKWQNGSTTKFVQREVLGVFESLEVIMRGFAASEKNLQRLHKDILLCLSRVNLQTNS